MYVNVCSIKKQTHDKLLHTWTWLESCNQCTWANNNDKCKNWTWTSWIFLQGHTCYLTNYDSDVLPNLWCYDFLISRRVKPGTAGNTWKRMEFLRLSARSGQEQLTVPRKYGRYVHLVCFAVTTRTSCTSRAHAHIVYVVWIKCT